jgi:hypothetical protein
MAIGRITGPLLASNLTRDGVNLTVDTTLFQFDVQSKRIGILTLNPTVALDVRGDIKGYYLTVNTATIGLVTISSNTSTFKNTIETSAGPIFIAPGSSSTVQIIADTTITGSLHVTGNITSDGDVRLGDNTSTDAVIFESDIKSDFIPWISTGTYSATTGTGTGTTATIFATNTSVVSNYSLGSTSNVWLGAYFNTLFANTLDTLSTVSNSTSTSTILQVFPDIPRLERSINKTLQVNGEIAVYGTNPLGTSPVCDNGRR